MKIRITYIYLGLFSLIVIYILIDGSLTKNEIKFNNDNKLAFSTKQQTNKTINSKPSKLNVNADIYHKLEKFKEKIDINPNDTLLMRKYAQLLSSSHKINDAIKYYNKILFFDKNRIDILFELSFLYYNKMDFNKTLDVTKAILKLDNNNVKAKYNLGAIYATQGKKNLAIRTWKEIIKEYPNSKEATLSKNSLKKI